MPGFDQSGPAGRGPMTGGGRGFCGAPARGGYYHNRFGGGFGRGWRHRFRTIDVPGRGWWEAPFAYRSQTQEEEMELLKREASLLERELKAVQQQINEMTADQPESGPEK